jgi:hypothetical protein
MSTSHRLLPGLLALIAALFCAPVLASSPLLCEDEQSVEPGDGEGSEPTVVAGLDETETILPCSMIESGQLGPWCAEATVYVVTQKGTLLCRVFLPNIDLSFASDTELRDRPVSPAANGGPTQAPPIASTSLPTPPAPPLGVDGAKIGAAASAAPAPLYREPPLVPG